MTRVHEADAVPCGSCGAPLAVDASSPYSWCRACQGWRPIPEEVRRAAWERWEALYRAHAALGEEQRLARTRAASARWASLKSQALTAVLVAMLVFFVAPTAATVALYLIASVLAALEELELWAAVPLLVGLSLVALAFVGAFAGACWFFYRRLTRHRRWQKLGVDAEWYGAGPAERAPLICCGSCGAPLWFQAGEQALECGHCRSVVVAPDEHAESVQSLALSELQLARRSRARAERALLRARLAEQRKALLVRNWLVAGSLVFLALPVMALGYAIRALTPSLEEAMLALAKELRGEFGSGLEPPFDWLDRYWIGTTPPTFEATGTLTSRWSIAASFHGRPVLVSVLASWTDFRSREAVLALACPRERDASRVLGSEGARKVAALGWQIHVDYAGIALVAGSLAQRWLDAATATALARHAYELAEIRGE